MNVSSQIIASIYDVSVYRKSMCTYIYIYMYTLHILKHIIRILIVHVYLNTVCIYIYTHLFPVYICDQHSMQTQKYLHKFTSTFPFANAPLAMSQQQHYHAGAAGNSIWARESSRVRQQREPSHKLTVCYRKLPFIVDRPMKNGDFP